MSTCPVCGKEIPYPSDDALSLYDKDFRLWRLCSRACAHKWTEREPVKETA